MHRVVIVGGGFGGLHAARRLRRAPVELTLLDRRNFHLFQPLLYEVATGSLSPSEIAAPLRAVLRRQKRTVVLLAEAEGFDLDGRRVLLDGGGEVEYDSLVVAAGARHAYFGHDEWEHFAPGLKDIEDALEIRRRILEAFEHAERTDDADRRAELLTFVIVGGGPTGVELAGQIAEIARDTLRGNFRRIDPASARVLVFDPGERLLAGFDPRLSAAARRQLESLGAEVRLGQAVVDVAPGVVRVRASADGTESTIPAGTVVWAAGVAASPLARLLAEATGGAVDHAGRVTVEPDLTLPDHPEVFALGDMVVVRSRAGDGVLDLPGVAPVAMQQGRHVGDTIRARLRGQTAPRPFRYRDKGTLATIGRARAVAEIKGLRASGFPAWVLWLFVHLLYLVGFENRVLVVVRWSFSYLTRGRGARLITGEGKPLGGGPIGAPAAATAGSAPRSAASARQRSAQPSDHRSDRR